MLSLGLRLRSFTRAAPNSAEAQAWFNRLMPYPTKDQEVILGTFVDALVAAGLANAFDFLYVNCLGNISNALTDVWRTDRQGRIFQSTSGLTFTANRGFSTGTIGHHVDSGFNPSAASGARYTLNNASVFYWCHAADGATAIAQDSVFAATEAAGTTPLAQLDWFPKWTGAGNATININCTATATAVNNVGFNRFQLLQRESSTSMKYYGDNDTVIVSSTAASTAMPNGTIRFRCTHPMSIMGAGRSFNSTERAALQNACEALVNSLTGGLP